MGCGNNQLGRPAVPSCQDTGWGCNYPVGMSPLELIGYDKTLYDLYRTNGGMGQGMIDAFPYDPVVSTGIFASQYQLSEGMAWAYLLRPDAQDNISVGDNLIVPVDTYTNNKAMPPYEKVMIGPGNEEYQTSSYAGSQLEVQADMVAANKGNLPPFAKSFNLTNKYNQRPVPFAGDLSSYFAQDESRILAQMEASTTPVAPNPILQPPSSSSSTSPSGPIVDPGGLGSGATVGPKIISTQPKTLPTVDPGGLGGSGGSSSGGSSQTSPDTGIVVTPGGSGSSGPTGGGAIVAPGGLGGGGVGGGGAAEADPGSSEPAADQAGAPAAKAVCATSWVPVIIGLLVGTAIGYYFADQKDKKGMDKIKYTALAAVGFGLLGYLYAKHKCTPIALLTKMGVKSESGFCAGCGAMGM